MLPEDLLPSYEPLFKKKAEDKELWKLVKAADKISGYLKCVDERKAGNSEFIEAEERLIKSIEKSELEEVQIFKEEFLPSYEKTLDQMKK